MNLGKKAQLTYIFAPRAEEVYSSKSEPFMYKCAKLKTVILTKVKSIDYINNNTGGVWYFGSDLNNLPSSYENKNITFAAPNLSYAANWAEKMNVDFIETGQISFNKISDDTVYYSTHDKELTLNLCFVKSLWDSHNKTLMILNCAIIDEDPSALELLKKYVDETPTLNLIGAYPSAIDAVDGIRHSHLDILFLAIHMQQISGLEFAKVVPKNVKIIFTTAFKEYAIEAYKVHAFDYLLKPISYQDFMDSCKKVFDSYMQDDKYNPIKRDKFLIVKSDYKYVRIPFDKILFVESLKDYILFHLEGMENVSTLGNLKHLEERLPKERFRRVHRSYLANLSKFDYIERGRLIYGSLGVPISDTFYEEIKNYIDEHSA